ncbi:MAG TPA: hypothetical protein VGD38_08560, partial [Pyrinomonadaceae bacterium]
MSAHYFDRTTIYIFELTQNAFEANNVVGANTSRSALILAGGTPVNYAELGSAFAEVMPDEIAAFMSGQVSSEQGDHRKSILRNFREVEDALDQAR